MAIETFIGKTESSDHHHPEVDLPNTYRPQEYMSQSDLVKAIDRHYETIQINRPDILNPTQKHSPGFTRKIYQILIERVSKKMPNLYRSNTDIYT